jgi:hypothetical protein
VAAAAEDEHPLKALAPDGADHALAGGVGPSSLDRSDDPDTLGGEDGVEGGGVPGVGIADDALDAVPVVGQRIVAACWVTHAATGVTVTPAIRTRQPSWWMNTST